MKATTKRHLIPTEHQEQANLIRWWGLAYPKWRMLLFAIPNGGWRNIITARRLVSEGVVSGVADLFLAIPTKNFHGAFIEMKRIKGGKQSISQKEFEKHVQMMGYMYILGNGWENAANEINKYLNTFMEV